MACVDSTQSSLLLFSTQSRARDANLVHINTNTPANRTKIAAWANTHRVSKVSPETPQPILRLPEPVAPAHVPLDRVVRESETRPPTVLPTRNPAPGAS
ncbi:hypothetical protein CTA1_4657 [Colletotrichum tanaceti]|uniref:Uncharacterized protein n=1 Tax=Colletotrichum tanaceti TaxID=1306861 RepID=A0A4U6X3W5_9PEZI|nr:hypothetical protein CTA1_4657 [Colletotrichum tanaceti]